MLLTTLRVLYSRDRVLFMMATVAVVLLALFMYLFINNIASNVIWSSSLPVAISAVIGIGAAYLSNIADHGVKLNIYRELKLKVLPTIIGGLSTTLVVIWYGLQADKVTAYFPARIMYNSETGNVLERDDEVFRDRYGFKFYQIRQFTDRILRPEYSKDAQYKMFFYDDLLFAEVLTLLFSANNDMRGSLQSDLGLPYYNSPVFYVPRDFLKEHELLTELGRLPNEINDIFNQLKAKNRFETLGLNRMYVPNETKIEINYHRFNKKIVFKNRFYKAVVEVMSFGEGGGNGLGEWQWILNYNEDKNNDYVTAKMGILITVDFAKSRMGHPNMPYYQIWIDAIIRRLEIHFDSELHLRNGREIHHLYNDKLNESRSNQSEQELKIVSKDDLEKVEDIESENAATDS